MLSEIGADGALDLVASCDGGTVAGRVGDKDDKAVPNAMVALIPRFAGRETRVDFQYFESADQNGVTVLKGVYPGDYTAYAFAPGTETYSWMDPEFLKIHGKGERITVSESGSITVSLTVR